MMIGCGGGGEEGSMEKPEANRFTKVVIAEGLDEPMALTTLDDGRVLIAERKGKILMYNPDSAGLHVAMTLPVSTLYTNDEGKQKAAEDGILGLVQDPNFKDNGWVYVYYSPEGPEAKNVIGRFEMKGNEILPSTEKVLLEIPTQRKECCHAGGGMVFDSSGNLYLSTGDNTNPFSFVSGFAPLDERPGREPWDAQRTAANTNDLRGKIIRIHPTAEGSYTIPEGNLFPEGTANTRPEIYVMGVRNPWRLSIDRNSQFLYWGEVGSDMKDSVGLGPYGVDEFNQARAAGNFGWPYIVGDNQAFWDRDFETEEMGDRFDPEHPVNTSVNNTGLQELPPAQPALIYYSYVPSERFPDMGSGGRSAVGGPVFRRDNFRKDAKRVFPAYYEGKWFITEFMRGWIKAVTLDDAGNYVTMEDFLPEMRFDSPIDMKFGAEGDLYLIEYGSAWFRQNDNARLVRIEYNGGNRPPVPEISADKIAGKLPLQVHFDAGQSTDPDADQLTYEWSVATGAGKKELLNGKEMDFTFEEEGVHTVTLIVTDAQGAVSSKEMEIKAGNEPPVIDLAVVDGNQTFFFPGQPFAYTVNVHDEEDGDTRDGSIPATAVDFSIGYRVQLGNQTGGDRFGRAKELILASDCQSCHLPDEMSAGPSFKMIAAKYSGDGTAPRKLAQKVISGGSGVWGEIAMSAHPQLAEDDAMEMVSYILSFDGKAGGASLPLAGNYRTSPDQETGYYELRASYEDKGAGNTPAVNTVATHVLRSNTVLPETSDSSDGVELITSQGRKLLINGPQAFLGFKNMDLSGIKEIRLYAQIPAKMNADGATVEIRSGSLEGEIISGPVALDGNTVLSRRDPLKMVIKPTDTAGDVYFVFKRPGSPVQAFLQLSSIQFLQ